MAWIKIEDCTPDKPEVIQLANILGIDQDAVLGKLIRVWLWADAQTYDGNAKTNAATVSQPLVGALAGRELANAPSVSKAFLDRCTYCPGFGAALEQVGWLTAIGGVLSFPNFDRHNGQTAKQRAVTAKRVAKHTAKTNAETNAATVSQPLVEPLAEKSRVEKSKSRVEEIREDGSKDASCGEPAKPASPPQPVLPVVRLVLEYPCVGDPPTWALTATKLAEYQETFPHLDVLAECRLALQWCRDNAPKRKTANGMTRFLGTWLAKAQNTGKGGSGQPAHDRLNDPTGNLHRMKKFLESQQHNGDGNGERLSF